MLSPALSAAFSNGTAHVTPRSVEHQPKSQMNPVAHLRYERVIALAQHDKRALPGKNHRRGRTTAGEKLPPANTLELSEKGKMSTPTPSFQPPPPHTHAHAQNSLPQPAPQSKQNKKRLYAAALAFFATLSVALAGLWGYSAWNAKRVVERFDAQAEALATQLEASVPVAKELKARSTTADATVTQQGMDSLSASAAESEQATDALVETVDHWLASPYFIVEDKQGGKDSSSTGVDTDIDADMDTDEDDAAGSGASDAPEIKVTYDPTAVPDEKKTSSTLKEIEDGEETLTKQTETATELVEELEDELGDAVPAMDVSQILAGDYSSINGLWESEKQHTLTVEGSTILWDDRPDDSTDGPIVEGLTLHYFDRVEDGSPDTRDGASHITWAWQEVEGRGGSFGSCLVFFPAGEPALDIMNTGDDGNPKVIQSDESQDRILALSTNCVGRMASPDNSPYLMYRAGETALVSAGEAVEAEEKRDPKESTGSCKAPVSGAYPCAGQGLPDGAQKIQTYAGDEATAVTPSGNIGCDINGPGAYGGAGVTCLVGNWDQSMVPNYDQHQGGMPAVGLGADSGPAAIGQKSDAPNYTGHNQAPAGQVMQYGNVYYFGDIALASEENGLTVWSLVSGHGAFFNRDGFWPF